MRITFYKTDGSGKQNVYPVDSGPYLRSSEWTTNPPDTAIPKDKKPETADLSAAPTVKELTRDEREAQLLAMLESEGYRPIKEISISHGITEKPSGGWDDAIPLILEKEFK